MAAKDTDEKKLKETTASAVPVSAPQPAPTPEVKVEGPENQDDKKQELQKEQKKEAQQPQDTGRNLMNTSTWIEFFAELMKYFRENSAQKQQQQTPKQTDEKLPNETWKKASEASPGAKEVKGKMTESGKDIKMGGHRVSNEKFLNENLKDSGLTEPQVKGLAGMLDKQGVNLNAVQNQKGSQDNKAVAAGSESNKDFIQNASKQMGFDLPEKAISSFANMADKLGINLSSMMNKAMSKGADAAKGAQAGAGGLDPRVAALKSAQSGRQRSATVGTTAAASAPKKEEETRPRSESLGGGMKG